MKERSGLQAFLSGKCPRCRQGDMFAYSALKVSKFSKMHERCPHCSLRFEVEPGFWYGAMYVSYAITTGIVLMLGYILYNFFDDPPLWVYLTSVFVALVLPMPFVFRISRVVYIYMFSGVKYDERLAKAKT